MPKKLTPKMERFCQEMAKPRAKQQDAYRAAYDCSRMSYASVSVAASRLMADPRIALRIKEIRNDAAKECRWEIHDAAQPLFDVLDGALPIYKRKAENGVIDGDARLGERQAPERHVRHRRREGGHGRGGSDHCR